VRRRIVRDVDVGPPVAVVVADGDAEARTVRLVDAGGLADVDEMSVPIVVKEPRRRGTVRSRSAVVANPDRIVAQLVARNREVDVASDEQIEETVAIVIEERRAAAP